MADENLSAEPEQIDLPVEDVPEEAEQEYLEYTGDPANPTGIDFLSSHTIPKGDPLWSRNKIKMTKDLVWERDPNGPGIGMPGAKLRVPVEDIPADALKVLTDVPGYKRVTG